MLLLLLLLSPFAHSAVETRLLECAKALSQANRWVVPLAGHQTNHANQYDQERNLFHAWSRKNPQNLYFYSNDKLYVAEFPLPEIKPRLVNWNRVTVKGLPGGDNFLEYNASGVQRGLRRYDPKTEEEKTNFSDEKVSARVATKQEEQEAFALFLDHMGYLWDMRESVESPSWASYISNLGKGTHPPTAEEVRAMREACAVFFAPHAELNCRK